MDRNFILAIVLSMGVLLAWDMLVESPQRELRKEAAEAAAEAVKEDPVNIAGQDAEGLGRIEVAPEVSLEDALSEGPGRVKIETPAVQGSINLLGARIDDLSLKAYHETLDKENSPIIRLFTPRDVEHGHYIQQGWIADGKAAEATPWTLKTGSTLTPETPSLRENIFYR